MRSPEMIPLCATVWSTRPGTNGDAAFAQHRMTLVRMTESPTTRPGTAWLIWFWAIGLASGAFLTTLLERIL